MDFFLQQRSQFNTQLKTSKTDKANTQRELGNNYDDDYVVAPQGMSYNSVSPVPSAPPTRYPTSTHYPTVSSMPSFAPNYVPPAYTGGWLYSYYYYENSVDYTCPSTSPLVSSNIPPDYVYGIRLNTCFFAYQYMHTFYYYGMYTCGKNSYTYSEYNNSDCSGTPIWNDTQSFSAHSYDDNFYCGGSQGYQQCFYLQCTASTTLPIPSGFTYSVEQDYLNYYSDTNTCYNSEAFQGILNNKCIAKSATASTKAVNPVVTTYSTGTCSTVKKTKTYPTSCSPYVNSYPMATSDEMQPVGGLYTKEHNHVSPAALANHWLNRIHAKEDAKKDVQHKDAVVPKGTNGKNVDIQSYDDYYYNNYGDDDMNWWGAQGMTYTLYTTPAKTPTMKPTRAPTPAPTRGPTLPPTYSTGWFYINSYYTSAQCSGNPDYVYGTRMGVCLQNTTSTWYTTSCTSGSSTITTTTCEKNTCTGKVLFTQTQDVSSLLATMDYNGIPPNCASSMCTSDDNIPLPVGTFYTTWQDYDTYTSGSAMCYNPIMFNSIINQVCLPVAGGSSQMVMFPYMYSYTTPDCSGTGTQSPSIEQVCTPYSTVSADGTVTKTTPTLFSTKSVAEYMRSRDALLTEKGKAKGTVTERRLQMDDDDYGSGQPGVASSVTLITGTSISSSSSALGDGVVAGIIVACIIGLLLFVGVLMCSGIIGGKPLVLTNGFGGGTGGGYDSRTYSHNRGGVELQDTKTPAVNPMYNN